MSLRHNWRPYEQVARKWCDLAERRRAHYADLDRSGRWKRYYTEEEFLRCMREAMRDADRWAEIVGPSPATRQAAE